MKSYFLNKYKKQVLAISASLLLVASSCSSFLDPKPEDVIIDKDFFEDFYDAEFALRGSYAALQPLVESMFVTGEMRADLVKPGTGADESMLELAEHRVTANNRYTNWNGYYDLINRANYLLKNLPNVPIDANNFTTVNQKQYLGEAYYLRALAYFYLVRNFGDVPMVLTPTDDINSVVRVAATSQDVILDTIEANLNTALTLVNNVILIRQPNLNLQESSEGKRLRAVTGSVNTLLADVYLWRNKYADANTAIQRIYTDGRYSATSNYFDIFWSISLTTEPIFDINFNYSYRETNTLMKLTSNDPASGGKYMVAPSDIAPSVWGNVATKSGDTLIVSGDNRGFGASYAGAAPAYNNFYSTNKVIWKYLGISTRVDPNNPANVRPAYQSDAIWHVYRYGELVLMRAEALNRLGQTSAAIAEINRIRNRTGIGTLSTATVYTTEQLEDLILQERNRELAFEGKRWFDLVRIARRGRPEVLKNAVKARMGETKFTQLGLEAKLSNPNYWYLPYNTEELKLNPNLKQKEF